MRTFANVVPSIVLGILIGTCFSALASDQNLRDEQVVRQLSAWIPHYTVGSDVQRRAVLILADPPACANGAVIRVNDDPDEHVQIICGNHEFTSPQWLVHAWNIVIQ